VFYEDYSDELNLKVPIVFEEKEQVLALVKKNLQYASFINQDSIVIGKEFLAMNGPNWKKVANETAPHLFSVSSPIYACFLGFAYTIGFQVSTSRRNIAVVTKQQYFDSLELLHGSKKANEWIEKTRDEDFYFLAATHCEEAFDGWPPTPYYQPMSLILRSTTKLIQRLGYEGVTFDMPGMIVKVPNGNNHTVFNQKLSSTIDNQEKKYDYRLF
jgi:hypothetical protein